MIRSSLDSENILKENLEKIRYNISQAASHSGNSFEDITIVAATKTLSSDIINIAIKNGITDIGENRVQEFLNKVGDINNVNTHFIGHLQKNKVKSIIGKVNMIQSVDSLDLAQKISQVSSDYGLCTDILVQVNIGNDKNKFGLKKDDVKQLLYKINSLSSIKVRGLMSILPICDNKKDIYNYFNDMRKLFIDIKNESIDNISMDFLSMGMSSDYVEAVECGANMVRIGSALFGARN